MNIAILILAHKNENQLRLLIRALRDFPIYLHLDARSSLRPETFCERNIVHREKKVPVYWGSYNQIRATFALLSASVRGGHDYHLLISGQDLPLVSGNQIRDFFGKNQGLCFLNHFALPAPDRWNGNGGLDRITFFWPDHGNTTWLKGFRFLQVLQKKTGFRRTINLAFHGGANWFNLTREAAEFVVASFSGDPLFRRRFRFTQNGDEIWLQTILLNSPFRDRIMNDCLRYVDWDTGPEYPRILRGPDVQPALASGKLFARKFDETVDRGAIEAVLAARLSVRASS